MRIIADFHIHSSYSRATSKDLNIANLSRYARIKGLNLLGTGDLTHPTWLSELRRELKEDGSGILRDSTGMSFVLQGEVSLIYSAGGKGRRIHNIVLAPDFETAEHVISELKRRGRVDYDGRPIFSIPCPEFVEMMKAVSPDVEIIPAHCWTPWFSLFGSMSGFDSVEECFQDQTKHIFALETGLSSDPAMNWRLSSLDRYALVSNSDCHSFWPWRLGREANVFEMDSLTYRDFIRTMKERDPKRFLCTIEVNPSYGKYHYDGHRACNVCMKPSESRELKDICPVCRRPVTKGVMHRVEELADREEGYVPKNAIPFRSVIPLSEIIAAVLGTNQLYSKRVWEIYNMLVTPDTPELDILLNTAQDEIEAGSNRAVAEAVIRVREGRIKINPGYDGVYGVPVFDEARAASQRPARESGSAPGQRSLADFG